MSSVRACRGLMAPVFAGVVLLLGGGFALWDATYRPDRSGLQLDSIFCYFVYAAASPAIAVIFFRAHRNRARQMLWALTSVWFGSFISSIGQASKSAVVDVIGDIIYIGSVLVYMPIVIKFDKHRGVEECGRAYAVFIGMVFGNVVAMMLRVVAKLESLHKIIPVLVFAVLSVLVRSVPITGATKAFGEDNFIYAVPVVFFAFELGQVVLFLGTNPGARLEVCASSVVRV